MKVEKTITKVYELTNLEGGYIMFYSNGLQFIHLNEVKECKVIHTIATYNDKDVREYIDVIVNGLTMSFAGIKDLDLKNVSINVREEVIRHY